MKAQSTIRPIIGPVESQDVAELGRDIVRELRDRTMPEIFQRHLNFPSRVLMETDDLVLLATVAPLAIGHCLVFAKETFSSIAGLLKQRPSVKLQVDSVTSSFEQIFGHALRFEHGTTVQTKTACGVDRAHFHLFPQQTISVDDLIINLNSELGEPQLATAVEQLPTKMEYLWIHAARDDGFAWIAPSLPSQIMRRHIARQLKHGDWDWKLLTGWSRMRKTILKWQNGFDRNAVHH